MQAVTQSNETSRNPIGARIINVPEQENRKAKKRLNRDKNESWRCAKKTRQSYLGTARLLPKIRFALITQISVVKFLVRGV